MTTWTLAIDFGTSFTTAAISVDGAPPERVEFDDGQSRIPSLVLVDEAELVVGWTAYRQTALHPDRVWWAPKRAFGETQPRLFGSRAVAVTEAAAAVLDFVRREAVRVHGAGEPTHVHLTHPASWADARKETLKEAAQLAGIESPILLSEPEAAAIHFAGKRLRTGERVAVYDLGGGTFDAAVLEHTSDGEFETVGRPMGAEALGGEVFDELLRDFLEDRLREISPDDLRTLKESPRVADEFRKQVREAKEGLSQRGSYDLALPIGLERDSVRVTVEELEQLIRPDLTRSLVILEQTLEHASVTPDDLSGIYLTGGSTRIPLVARMVDERFGAGRTKTLGDPKTVVVLGAAAHTVPGIHAAPAPEPEPVQPEPEPVQPEPVFIQPPPTPPVTEGAPPPRDQWSGPRRHIAIAAAIAIAVIILAIVIGTLAGNNDSSASGDGGGTTPPPTETTENGGGLTAAEDALYLEVPETECTSNTADAPVSADAGIRCYPSDSPEVMVDYFQFPDYSSMNDEFNSRIGANRTVSSDVCGEGRVDTDTTAYACYLAAGDARLMFTSDDLNILGIAQWEDEISAAFGPLDVYYLGHSFYVP